MKAFPALAIVLMATTMATIVQAQKKDTPTVTVEKFEPPIKEADFLKNNPTVASVHWQKGVKITLALKNGKKESYNFKDLNERITFKNKYGTAPMAPPPPPPIEG